MKTTRGFVTLPVFAGIIVVLALGAVWYFVRSGEKLDGEHFLENISITAPNISSSQTKTDADISVPGMSKYTSDFGYSFWYPSSAVVDDVTDRFSFFSKSDQTIVKRFSLTVAGVTIIIDEINSPSRTIDVPGGACGYCAPVKYYFDIATHTWMQQFPDGIGGAPDMTESQFQQTKIPKP